MDEESALGYINIRITDSEVEYDSEYSLVEVVFWLETLKSMLVKRVIDQELPE